MELKDITVNMMVDDVNATMDYYTSIFGFQKVMSVPETGKLDWAWVKHGEVALMFQSVNSLVKDLPLLKDRPVKGGAVFYLHAKDIEKMHDSIKDKVKIVAPPAKTFYGALEFTIEDLNGYILTFAENE